MRRSPRIVVLALALMSFVTAAVAAEPHHKPHHPPPDASDGPMRPKVVVVPGVPKASGSKWVEQPDGSRVMVDGDTTVSVSGGVEFTAGGGHSR